MLENAGEAEFAATLRAAMDAAFACRFEWDRSLEGARVTGPERLRAWIRERARTHGFADGVPFYLTLNLDKYGFVEGECVFSRDIPPERTNGRVLKLRFLAQGENLELLSQYGYLNYIFTAVLENAFERGQLPPANKLPNGRRKKADIMADAERAASTSVEPPKARPAKPRPETKPATFSESPAETVVPKTSETVPPPAPMAAHPERSVIATDALAPDVRAQILARHRDFKAFSETVPQAAPYARAYRDYLASGVSRTALGWLFETAILDARAIARACVADGDDVVQQLHIGEKLLTTAVSL